jgi:hypothetical protein
LNAAASSASVSGNSLTLNLSLVFSPTFAGTKGVYLYAQDNEGASSGWQQRGTWIVPTSGGPPSGVSVTPSSGGGTSQVFSFLVSDPRGYDTLGPTSILINAGLAQGGCYFWLVSSANLIYLYQTTTSTWLGPVLIGSGSLQNTQCTLNSAGSSILGSGSNLTIKLSLSFLPGFDGAKNLYLYAQDNAGMNSGWQQLGTWTTP